MSEETPREQLIDDLQESKAAESDSAGVDEATDELEPEVHASSDADRDSDVEELTGATTPSVEKEDERQDWDGARIEGTRSRIDARNLRAEENVNVAGRDIINNAYSEETRLEPVGVETLSRLGEFFVPPPAFSAREKHSFEEVRISHIAVIRGPDGTGRLTAALALASRLTASETRSKSTVFRCEKKIARDDLASIVDQGLKKKASVLIFEKVLERGVGIDELQDPLLSDLVGKLRQAAAYLIVTADLQVRGVEGSVPLISTANLDLQKVFQRAREFHASEQVDAFGGELAQWRQFSDVLKKPSHIHRFVLSLNDIQRVPTTKEGRSALLIRLAKEAASPGTEAIERWFDRLELDERLFAFLVSFFEGVTLSELIQLFVMISEKLRSQGATDFGHPISMRANSLIKRLHLTTIADRLEWEQDIYPRFVLGGPVVLHQHLLWEIAQVLLNRDDFTVAFQSPAMRSGLGSLLGSLARAYPKRVRSVLRDLSAGEWREGTIAAYAVKGLVEYRGDALEIGDGDQDFDHEEFEGVHQESTNQALRIVRIWSRSNRYRQRWTAAAAAWQIFDATPVAGPETYSMLSRLLYEVAKEPPKRAWADQGDENYQSLLWRARGSVDFALARILSLSEHPVIWIRQIARWWLHDDPRSDFPQIVIRALERYVIETGRQCPRDVHCLTGLLGLFSAIVIPDDYRAVYFAEPLEQIFRHMAVQWLRSSDGSAAVSEAARIVSMQGPESLRENLVSYTAQYWTQGPALQVSRLITARSAAMDGRSVYPPPGSVGMALLVVDSDLLFSESGKKGEDSPLQISKSAKQMLHQIASELSSRWQLVSASLGRHRLYGAVQDLLDHEEDLGGHLGRIHPQRLALPCLDNLDRPPEIAVIVAQEEVQDIEDFQSLVSRTQVLRLDVKPPPGAAAEATKLGIESFNLGGQESFIVWRDRIDQITTQGAAFASSMAWQPFVSLVASDGLSPHAVWSALRRLEDSWTLSMVTDGSGGQESNGAEVTDSDVIHLACGAVGWLAATDFRDCCERLAAWLDCFPPVETDWFNLEVDRDEHFGQWVAIAAARFLLRLYRQSGLSGRRELSCLFEVLAPSLCRADPVDGPATVLSAVEYWLHDESWVRYLASDVIAGRGRLIRWAERFLPEAVSEIAAKLPEAPSPEARALWNEAIYLLSDRRLAIPELPPERRYGLVVTAPGLGSAADRKNTTRLLKGLCSDPRFEPVLFDIGRTSPIWIRDQPLSRPWLHYRHPPLLFPLLESPEFDPQCVAFVLVIGGGRILDEEELVEGPWWNHVLRFQKDSSNDGFRWLGYEPRSPSKDNFFTLWQQAIHEVSERTRPQARGPSVNRDCAVGEEFE